ncbi:MFS transporter [Acidocella facilis]|uniref:MFS transporter n=1 Tax=Acidocella facilis TaxID=525 RepID=UPI001F2E972B|nr:MFS transporter [Acidocella facilis]
MGTALPAVGATRPFILLVAILFFSYLAIAMALPVVPVFAHDRLHASNGWSGLAVGALFLATLLTRAQAGRLADQHGGRACMLSGLRLYAAGSAICLLAAFTMAGPGSRFALLIAGRVLVGMGEGRGGGGAIIWGIGLLGPARSGRVIVLNGMAAYAALACGGPLGLVLFNRLGFAGMMAGSTLLPVLGLWIVRRFPAIAPPGGARQSFWRILARILAPGAVVGLQGIGFAGLGAFLPLYLLSRGWPHPGLGLSCLGGGFVLMRLLGGHLPDRLGAAQVAGVSLLVEALGQGLIWQAQRPWEAFLGALLTGAGCSLIFPAMGRAAIRRVEPQMVGSAIGGFSAFQDLAYGATGPVTGMIADRAGYGAVFLIGALAALAGGLIVLRMLRAPALSPPAPPAP